MKIDLADLRLHYDSLSDDALLAIDPDELIDAARACLNEEVRKRGLARETTQAGDAAVEEEQSELAPVAFYQNWDEATMARSLLRAAGIPAQIADLRPAHDIEVRVPKDLLEDASAVLNSEISEDDLIAQAEAAGQTDDDDTSAGNPL